MSYGELEPVPDDKAVVMVARIMCAEAAWEDECLRRVPEIDGLATWEEAEQCRDFLKLLDDEDPTSMFELLEETCQELGESEEYEAVGWLESGRGSVFVPYRGDEGDEDDEGEDD